MTCKEKLLKVLPKKYHDRVRDLEYTDDCDTCKYIFYYTKEYTDGDAYGGVLPFKSIKEICDFIKYGGLWK